MKALQKFKNIGIPNDWATLRLKKFCTFNYGTPLSDANRINGPYPVYGSNGIVGWHNSYFVLGPGIIVGRKGTAGEVSWSNNNFTPIDTTFYITLRNGDDDLKYLYYLLQICGFEKFSGATGVPGLNRNDAYKLLIPAPSPFEQKAIAGIISKVDEAIEAVENSIKAAERLKKSLMQNLLTGKIKPNGTWRSENDFYMDEKFGKVPVGWDVSKVKDFGEVHTGKTPPTAESNVFSENATDPRYPFITPGDLGENKHIFTAERYVTEKGILYSHKLPIGTVCVVCIGSTIGKIGIADTEICTNQQINSLVPNKDNCGEFFYYMMLHRTLHFKEIAGVNATPQINKSDFKKYKLLRPKNRLDQEQIAEKISVLDGGVLKNKNKIQFLKNLKKALMQNLLTGRVRVDVEKINKLLEEV